MKNKIIFKSRKKLILSVLVFSFLFLGSSISASTNDGTIDSTYRYAWGENVGFVDFGSTAGDVHITNSSLSGYAYGENIGWINLTGVTNDGQGNLSGYAWGENVGFIDFSKVSINSTGVFQGSAYGENIGWITFGEENNKVVTNWRPTTTRSYSSSGSYVSKVVTPVIPPVTPSVSPTTCLLGQLFDTTTGLPCPTTQNLTNPNPLDGQAPLNITRILKLTTPLMRGDDIKELQTYLNAKNYNSGIIDGVFGKLTKQAVISFQLANELKGDGIVGPLTRSKLK